MHVHWVAPKHPDEGCELCEVTQGILSILVSHAGNKVHIEEVPASTTLSACYNEAM